MVIYLNGSINSGKSTIAKLIISRIPQTVHIECERNRIAHLYASGIHNPSFGMVIDNSDQSPETTAEEIVTAVLQPSESNCAAIHRNPAVGETSIT